MNDQMIKNDDDDDDGGENRLSVVINFWLIWVFFWMMRASNRKYFKQTSKLDIRSMGNCLFAEQKPYRKLNEMQKR